MADFYDEEGAKKVNTQAIKCASCGGNMIFDPESQMLYCEHCGTKQSFSQNFYAEEIDLEKGLSGDNQWKQEGKSVFRCDNCGAQVVLQKGETATSCPFCGTAHVEKVDELIGLKPNGVLPFLFKVDKAIEYVKHWAKRKIFAPSKFKKSLNPENVKGVYTPCFTFDSCTTSRYIGRIGTRHTRVVGSGNNRRTETYIVWRGISGVYSKDYDDILITAGSKFDQKRLNKVSPFDTNGGKKYEEKYMLGFMAYHYDREISDCWADAKKVIDKDLYRSILSQYRYDVVDFLKVSTSHERVTYKYVMLPVYVGAFNFRQKLYNFFVNGTSGKVAGKTPVSPLRVFIAVLIGLGIVAGIGLLVFLLNK